MNVVGCRGGHGRYARRYSNEAMACREALPWQGGRDDATNRQNHSRWNGMERTVGGGPAGTVLDDTSGADG